VVANFQRFPQPWRKSFSIQLGPIPRRFSPIERGSFARFVELALTGESQAAGERLAIRYHFDFPYLWMANSNTNSVFARRNIPYKILAG
jgi:hypothetical protein